MSLVSFENIPIQECSELLVDLAGYDFMLEPVYFKTGSADTNKMYLRQGVADKLLAIQKEFKIYKFKIWDGYRPRVVQNNIYEKYWQELKKLHPEWDKEKMQNEVGVFITNAQDTNRIPPHATGGAVDLTLVDAEGKELNMGTEFDYFGPEAAVLYFEGNNINDEVRQNRKLLREAMEIMGFRIEPYEWWHYDYGNQLWASTLHKPAAIYGETFPEKC